METSVHAWKDAPPCAITITGVWLAFSTEGSNLQQCFIHKKTDMASADRPPVCQVYQHWLPIRKQLRGHRSAGEPTTVDAPSAGLAFTATPSSRSCQYETTVCSDTGILQETKPRLRRRDAWFTNSRELGLSWPSFPAKHVHESQLLTVQHKCRRVQKQTWFDN